MKGEEATQANTFIHTYIEVAKLEEPCAGKLEVRMRRRTENVKRKFKCVWLERKVREKKIGSLLLLVK